MRLARPVMGDRDERVELAAQLPKLAVHRGRRGFDGTRRSGLLVQPGPPLQLFVLALVQQRTHLLGVEQARDAEVVGLLVAARRRGGAER